MPYPNAVYAHAASKIAFCNHASRWQWQCELNHFYEKSPKVDKPYYSELCNEIINWQMKHCLSMRDHWVRLFQIKIIMPQYILSEHFIRYLLDLFFRCIKCSAPVAYPLTVVICSEMLFCDPVWHQQSFHGQRHLDHISSPFWHLVWKNS